MVILMPPIEPFVRWAGGKSWLVPYVKSLISNLNVRHYFEPFLGGGAVYFSIDFSYKSYLSDINSQLINTYIQIRDNPELLISYLSTFKNTESDYYQIRSNFTSDNTVENAARFIFLNQTSYNGLFRVNKTGHYNVPYGFRKNMNYDFERIRSASVRLHNANISIGDFELNKHRIKEYDLVFLDPPYTVSHNNNGFIAYNQKLFSLDDQERLKLFIEFIKNKGAFYILTNAAHEVIRDIFSSPEDRLIELKRNSLIGGKNAKRVLISEYIFTNIPEAKHD